MEFNADVVKNKYFSWLREQYKFNDLQSGAVKIQTPFLDSDFDYIVLYVEQTGKEKFRLTDDGWTLDNLESAGMSFNKRATTRLKIINDIAVDFGVEVDLNSEEIYVFTDYQSLAEAKHRLLLAIMRINDLLFLAKNNVQDVFVDDVQELLDEQAVMYTKNILVPGMAGLTFHYDFAIPGTQGNEKLIRTIQTPNNLNGVKILTLDSDLASRTRKSKYIGILNDQIKPVRNRAAINGLEENSQSNVKFVTFSEIKADTKILVNAG